MRVSHLVVTVLRFTVLRFSLQGVVSSAVVTLAVCGGGLGCGGALREAAAPIRAIDASPADGQPLLGDAWFEARARALGLTVEAARARDAAFSESEPPDDDGPPDAQLATQSSALWATQCASCHGATGRLENVPPTLPRPRELGTTGMAMGFFFGGDKMRAGLYRKIAYGEPPAAPLSPTPSPMPKWAPQLSREQLWALVAFIEGL